MPIRQVILEAGHPVKVWTDEFEASARQQLVNIASLPFIHHHVAAMPDVHTGIGATVGSVIATHKAIIPAAVGVDTPRHARLLPWRDERWSVSLH